MKTLEDYNQKYAGRTCFIISPGTSILEQLTSSVIDKLKKHITIAVNSGILAVPLSNFFVSDDWSVVHWSYFFKDLKENETTIPLLYEDKLGKVTIFGDRPVLFKHRQGYHITDKYEHREYSNRILEARTSVGTAIHIAHIMGCDDIVLLGLDGCRQGAFRYFWQLQKFKRPYRDDLLDQDRYHKKKKGLIHTDTDLMEIAEYWTVAAPYINKKCKVYNASPLSRLGVFERVKLSKFL